MGGEKPRAPTNTLQHPNHPPTPQLSPTTHPHSPQLPLPLLQNRSATPYLSPHRNAAAPP